jgi:hypothetical protein
MKNQAEKIQEAKNLLKESGYYVDNLWHIEDVKGRLKCDDETAYDILDSALTNDATFEQIWFSIDEFIRLHKEEEIN